MYFLFFIIVLTFFSQRKYGVSQFVQTHNNTVHTANPTPHLVPRAMQEVIPEKESRGSFENKTGLGLFQKLNNDDIKV